MNVAEVLKRIPGITRQNLQWWETEGWISPKRIKRGKVDRREYREEDFWMIKAIWKYYSQGISPKIAYEKALEDIKAPQQELSKPAALYAPNVPKVNQGKESEQQPIKWSMEFTDNGDEDLVHKVMDLILEEGGKVLLLSPVKRE